VVFVGCAFWRRTCLLFSVSGDIHLGGGATDRSEIFCVIVELCPVPDVSSSILLAITLGVAKLWVKKRVLMDNLGHL